MVDTILLTNFPCFSCDVTLAPIDVQHLNDYFYRTIAKKEYSMNDHLGNVRATVSDRKYADSTANILSYTHYYSFGTELTGKTYNSNSYKFGYNGKLKDDEVFNSSGTFYDYGERALDVRGVPLFLREDQLTKSYPWYTPYQYAGNTPIQAVDLDGLEPDYILQESTTFKGYYKLTNPAITLLNIAGISEKSLANTWIKIDQKFHDATTQYQNGAITLGQYMIFTGNFGDPNEKGEDGQAWTSLLAHEVGHRKQADEMGNSYFTTYIIQSIATMFEKGTTNANKIHDDIPMEKEAEGGRQRFMEFYNSYNVTDSKGNIIGNKINDVLSDKDMSDDDKSAKITDMHGEYNRMKRMEQKIESH